MLRIKIVPLTVKIEQSTVSVDGSCCVLGSVVRNATMLFLPRLNNRFLLSELFTISKFLLS